MTAEEILKKLNDFYRAAYDLEDDYQAGDMRFPLYGRFRIERSRYLLTKTHKLWEAAGNEYVFFHICQTPDLCYEKELDRFLKETAEPVYVRNGQKYPPANHMYSYITLIIITDRTAGEEFQNFVKTYKYEKNYLLSVRGYSEVRIVLISEGGDFLITNRAGREVGKVFRKLLKG